MAGKPDWLKEIMPALVTPFTREEEIDEEAMRRLIRHVLPHVNAVVPVGTTGEFVYLSEDEKRRLIDITIDEVGGQRPVIAGTGCANTKDTVALTQFAKDAGAHAARHSVQHPSDGRDPLQMVDSRGHGLSGQRGGHQRLQWRCSLPDGPLREG